MILYSKPDNWIKYDRTAIADMLAEAKAAVLSLITVPFQRQWVDALQQIELKREVAGTSRIEGAEFTEKELDSVLKQETPEDLLTRSQRQAAAAKRAYDWIKALPQDQPVDELMIFHIHTLMVTDADDDHCEPGVLRGAGNNVTFGTPGHRGVEGGDECRDTFSAFVHALQNDFREHDRLVQAIAAHYHIAAMHPFLDGNGRTARALEALLLGRAHLRRATFIAMSNYYYDEKAAYLTALAQVRAAQHDLTPFLNFALKGIAFNAQRMLREIQGEIKRALVRSLMLDFTERLRSPRKRVIAQRQAQILQVLLEKESFAVEDFVDRIDAMYKGMKSPHKAFERDVGGLMDLQALIYDPKKDRVRANLDWPMEITATQFFETVKALPKAKASWLRRS